MRFLPRVQALACCTSHACSAERPGSGPHPRESLKPAPHGWRTERTIPKAYAINTTPAKLYRQAPYVHSPR